MAPDGRPAAKLPAKYGGDDDVEWNEKFSAGEACAGPEGVDAEDDEPGRDGPHEDDESHAVEGCEALTGLPPCASPWSCHCALSFPWSAVEVGRGAHRRSKISRRTGGGVLSRRWSHSLPPQARGLSSA